jgi:hypothetical protein
MKKICLPLLWLFLVGPLAGQEGEPIAPPPAAEETADTESISTETAATETAATESGSTEFAATEFPEAPGSPAPTEPDAPASIPAPAPAAPALPPVEAGSYEDLLNRLVLMEELVFQGEEGIEGIRNFKDELSQSGYPELEAEAALLEFLLIRRNEEDARLAGLEGFLTSMEEAARKEEQETRKLKSRRIWTGVTLGTSLLALGGVTYLRSMGNETYQSYLEAQTPQESAFYQGWWRTWDLASAVTGGVGVLSFTAFLYFFGSSL